jgi:geranylgeranyl pyrophosphate synthase
LIHALENLAEAENAELRGLLFRKEYKVEDILRARELFYVSGSVEYLQSEIARLTAAAREALSILPDNKYKMLLLELADYLVDREK